MDSNAETQSLGKTTQETSLPVKDSLSDKPDVQQGNIIYVSANWINIVLGIGILGLPQALYNCGFVFGMCLLILVFWMSDYTSRMLIDLAQQKNVDTYEDLCQEAFGKVGFFIVSFFCILFDFGALIAYIAAIKQTIPVLLNIYVFNHYSDYHQQLVSIITTIVVMVGPVAFLCSFKDLSKLSFTSTLSVIVFSCIYVISCVESARIWNIRSDINLIQSKTFILGVGKFLFAMISTDSVFQIHQTLKNPTTKRWNLTTHLSMVFLFLLYGTFGAYLYFFAPAFHSNILNSFPKTLVSINVARFFLGITMIFTFPMSNFIFRIYLKSLIKFFFLDLDRLEGFWLKLQHYGITYAILIFTTVIALFVKLGLAMEFTGLAAATGVGFMIPAALYFKIKSFDQLKQNVKDSFNQNGTFKEKIYSICDIVLPAFIFLFGIGAFAVGIPYTIKSYSE